MAKKDDEAPKRRRGTRAMLYVGDALVVGAAASIAFPGITTAVFAGQFAEAFGMIKDLPQAFDRPTDLIVGALTLLAGLKLMSAIRRQTAGKLRLGGVVAF